MRLRFYSLEGASRWSWRYTINQRVTLRQRIGMRLRDLADRIDRHRSIAVRIQTDPALTNRQETEIFQQGILAIERALRTETEYTAEDALMREKLPFLWKERSGDTEKDQRR